jgi:nucleoside phosphorylase
VQSSSQRREALRDLLPTAALNRYPRCNFVPPTTRTNLKAESVDIGIITIREDEFRAVLAEFSGSPALVEGRRAYNLRDADAGGGLSYRVAILRQAEQGNGEAQAAARDLLEELNPRLLLVVGIAGGLPSDDLTLGDVVLSTRVNDYSVEARKEGAEPEYSLSGGPVETSIAHGLVNLPAREADLGDWRRLLPEPPELKSSKGRLYGPVDWRQKVRTSLNTHFLNGRKNRPALYVAGTIASSDRLVKDPMVLFPWIQSARSLLAVEMESGGVFRAAQGRVPMLAIRGVSDIVGLKRNSEWTKYACLTAAAFASAYLRTRPIAGPSAGSSLNEPAMANTLSGFLPIATSLPSRLGKSVDPVVWRFDAAGSPLTGVTKAELYDALEHSVVRTVEAYGRETRWPAAMRSAVESFAGGSRWRVVEPGAANHIKEEQVVLYSNGNLSFQRAVFWDSDNLMVEVSEMASDLLVFLSLVGRFRMKLARHGEIEIATKLGTPKPNALAFFLPDGPVSEDPMRSARLPILRSGGESRVMPIDLNRGADALVVVAKRVIDGVVNEFTLAKSMFAATSRDFMAIDAASLLPIAKRICAKV